jgi:hypothetical protein
MKGSYRLLAVFCVAMAGAYLSACQLSESCDPNTDPNCVVDGGTDAGADTTVDTSTDEGGGFQTYHYVLIQDLENPNTSSPTHTAGVDIDAVGLTKNGAAEIYAAQVHECNFGPGDNAHATNCNLALGAPQNGCSPTGTPDYVSLGGDGGYIIVSFTNLAEIDTGNTLRVYECGSQQNPGATAEHFDASVGVATTLNDPHWVACITNGTGIAECTVPNLPQVPNN